MSVLAVVLTLCTYAACNDYAVDTATTRSDAQTNLEAKSDSFADAWAITTTDKPLVEWLHAHNIVEDVRFIQDYDFTIQEWQEEDTP